MYVNQPVPPQTADTLGRVQFVCTLLFTADAAKIAEDILRNTDMDAIVGAVEAGHVPALRIADTDTAGRGFTIVPGAFVRLLRNTQDARKMQIVWKGAEYSGLPVFPVFDFTLVNYDSQGLLPAGKFAMTVTRRTPGGTK